jgi:hypothetical protein
VHHSILAHPTSATGHFRQIDPLPTLSACPLRSDRVRTFAPQRFDAVCQRTRLGLDNPSEEYLAGYVEANEKTPQISLDCVMKAAGLIESMGARRLLARKTNE